MKNLLSQIPNIYAYLFAIIGIVFLHWDLKVILLGFWLENIVIGGFNAMKIWKAEKVPQGKGKGLNGTSMLGAKIIAIAFFCIHYGGFCAGHLILIYGISELFAAQINVPNPSYELVQIFPLLLCYAAYHLRKYREFLERQDYKQIDFVEQMFQPYHRIILVHVSIIITAACIIWLAQSGWLIHSEVQMGLLLVVKLAMEYHEDRGEEKALER